MKKDKKQAMELMGRQLHGMDRLGLQQYWPYPEGGRRSSVMAEDCCRQCCPYYPGGSETQIY